MSLIPNSSHKNNQCGVVFSQTHWNHYAIAVSFHYSITSNPFYKNVFKDVANSGRVFKSRDRALTSRKSTGPGVHLTCNACLFVYFFNLFVGLFGLITFDPFYKTNNTLILHALVAVQLDFGHSQCFANRTRRQSRAKPSRSVRNIVNVLNACCTAANAWRNVYY